MRLIGKSRFLTIVLTGILLISILAGCAKKETENKNNSGAQETTVQEESVTIRVGSLKGPTSMGLVHLMDLNDSTETENSYEFTMETDASALLPLLIKGDLDIALIPANLAATLYQKMDGELKVLDINTGSVLYLLSGNSKISKISDLKGKTIYLPGKGTTPDYVLSYLLKANGLTENDVTVEYKSEATEVAAALSQDKEACGLLPQPFATSACIQDPDLGVRIDIGEEWKFVEKDSSVVTGVTVVRSSFLKSHPQAVSTFLKEQEASAEYANTETESAAELVVKYGILAKAAIAQKAMPLCSITYIDGKEMKTALSGYLTVLYDMQPESVGGKLPGDDFYYEAE